MIDVCPFERPAAGELSSMKALLYFTWEREVIRIAREAGLPREEWTTDPVLQKYKFTNIRRRDDRVSRWVIEQVINPQVAARDRDLWFTLLVTRLINWPPALTELILAGVLPCAPEEFDARLFVEVLEDRKARGLKVYSGAYMLYPTMRDPGGRKSEAVARHIIGDVVERADNIRFALRGGEGVEHSVERVVNALSACFGISTFMAGQVAADLTYSGLKFSDLYSYAPRGPGSQRGLNYLLNRAPHALWTQEAFNATLKTINQHIRRDLRIIDLTLHDVQNVMCEYSKYARAVLGEGKPKTVYRPEQEF